MPPPSSLAIASSAVSRLLKEEASYRQELVGQEAQVRALQGKLTAVNGEASSDGNEEFMLKQLRTAVEQTKAVFAPLRTRIAEAVAKLEEGVAASEQTGENAGDLEQAKSVLAQAKTSQAA
ncbi:hypothetical protein CDD81_3942 [Ophiocordyceps australis]|uniref:Tubulin-specific chaperone A n=1 Tax=Ophiocordyceps australis TaxID=1399860 RepID=A0A2C5XU97_9HYPO|nr:hypothetical protein CDD81_3942 [Ophiocordyceps australis]